MAFDRRHTAAAIIGVLGIAGAFVLVPDPPPVLTVAPEPGEAAYTSIQEAVDALGPRGGTVEVLKGSYAERVVIDGRRGVSLRARTGDRVVLDASGIEPGAGLSGVVEVRGGSMVEVAGLELTGYRAQAGGEPDAVPSGLLVTGSVEGLTVEGVTVHGIGADDDPATREAEGEAYGIAVLGGAAGPATAEVVISGSTVHDLDLGTGGAIVVGGDVRGWEVTGNRVHDVDHVGIMVGGGTASARPRDGLVNGNTVQDVTAADPANSALGPDGCLCAPGLRVDGALDVTLSDNTVERADIGLEVVAPEVGRVTEGIDVVENVLRDSRSVGMTVGEPGGADGATPEAGQDDGQVPDEDAGTVSRVLLRGNSLRGAPEQAMVELGSGLSDVRFSSNEVEVSRVGPVLIGLAARGPVLDHNRYVAAEPVLRLGERAVTELRAWQLLTRQDVASSLRVP